MTIFLTIWAYSYCYKSFFYFANLIMIIANNIEKSFGPQILFGGVSFLMNEGERVGLVGKNGTGKVNFI